MAALAHIWKSRKHGSGRVRSELKMSVLTLNSGLKMVQSVTGQRFLVVVPRQVVAIRFCLVITPSA